MFSWNPSREAFRLPYFDLPVFWYGVFFAVSFYLGYYIFLYLLTRYFSNFPEILSHEILCPKNILKKTEEKSKKNAALLYLITKGEKVSSAAKLRSLMNRFIQTEKNWDDLALIEGKKRRISCWKNNRCAKKAALRYYLEKLFPKALLRLEDRAALFSDRLLTVVILCTVVGARLFHLIFYHPPSFYLSNPWRIFAVREGGLASHGAAVAIFFGVYIFAKKYQPQKPVLSFITILDLIAAPACFVGSWIRLGNFFNQEILGKPTTLPWAVAFGHPMDGSMPWVPRHPVQLYEASFYFFVFCTLFYLATKTKALLQPGRLAGLFFILIFSFRIFVEFFKERQSFFTTNTFFTMGQMLSIPFCFLGLGCFLASFLFPRKKRL